MIRPDRDRLAGRVEEKLRGDCGGCRGSYEPRGFGRIRLRRVPDRGKVWCPSFVR